MTRSPKQVADFEPLAATNTCSVAAVRHRTLPIYGVQFHPEVTHTPLGKQVLANFVRRVCGASGAWQLGDFAEHTIENVRARVGDRRVICGLSGGVDSSVVAALLYKAVGQRLSCILVDNGLLRKDEAASVIREFSGHFRTDLHVVAAEDRFLSALAGVSDPQEKRRRIGRVFIECFADEAAKIEGAEFLAQGTLYPDVIESGAAVDGPAATIKLHHNVGGLPEDLSFELIEPLRDLFKDEVRRLGRSSACLRRSSGGIHSLGRGWPCAAWDLSRASGWRGCAKPTPSSSKRSALPGFIGRRRSLSRCSCPCRAWVSWGTHAPMRTRSPCDRSTPKIS